MTEHTFETRTTSGRHVHVLMFWYQPLHQFFLVVEGLDVIESDDCPDRDVESLCPYLYCNLYDPQSIGMQDLDYYRQKLTELGIVVPEQMFKQVKADQTNKVGNRYVNYNSDAAIRA